jgi:hypothetical protein
MEVMTMDEKSRGLRSGGNEPTVQRQRLPWHAPKLMVERVQHLTGTHATTSGGDAHPHTSNVS